MFTITFSIYRCRSDFDVTPTRSESFNDAMERVCALSRRAESILSAPDVAPGCIEAAREAPNVLRDRISAVHQATRVASRKRKKDDSSRSSKSPRTVYTYEATDSSTLERSACSSSRTSFDINTVALTSPGMIQSDGLDGPPDVIPTTEPFGESSTFSRPIPFETWD